MPTDIAGEVIDGQYEIVRHLGGGGMAQVYLAKSRQTGQQVAVKLMNTEQLRKSKSVERFKREGRLLCKLKHPNLVQGFSMGEHEGKPYISMEYVDGPSIAELIEKRGSIHPDEAMKLLLDATLALNHLFVDGSVQAHRDVKPNNIMITPGGTAKLADFGIARAYSETEQMTLTATTLGSPHYMSPEQIDDPRAADIRSDIYALGAVFYEMLTGDKAYPGKSQKDIFDAHFELEAPTFEGKGPLVEAANEILAKTLAFDPCDRFQTPRELAERLAPLIDSDVNITIPRVSRNTMRFVALAGGAAIILVVFSFAFIRALDRSGSAQKPAATPVVSEQTNEQASSSSTTSNPTPQPVVAPTPAKPKKAPSMGSVSQGSGSGATASGASGGSTDVNKAADKALDDN